MGVLDEILATKRDEVTVLHEPRTRSRLQRAALEAGPTRDFAGALRRGDGRLAVVGELKRRSPSKGELSASLDPEATAKAYATGGASALSVLTDGPWFGGSVTDLQIARAATDLPVLRKDFVIDGVQLFETRGIGADGVLLIVAAVADRVLLADLHDEAVEIGLSALLEVHDEWELERAVDAGARLVGVNNRSLDTFDEDLGVAQRLVTRIPAEIVAVAESAVRGPDDAARMAEAGFDAVLVGEALVRAADPAELAARMGSSRVAARAG
jgi:indole-3-glycerol phosphate synthase